jgi:FKBP-type peptidyl-prolyl cis-trans isomerase
MKYLAIALVMTFLLSGLSWAGDLGQTLETRKEKESYSIGYQVGLSMRSDGVEADLTRLIRGLQDAVDLKDPLLSHDDMRSLIVDLKKKTRVEEMRKLQENIVRNAGESEKFLSENGKKEGITITESGLQYKIVREGNGILPQQGNLVTIHYRGTFIDGREFDSSYSKGAPQTVRTDGVIKGWQEALPMMSVGAKWEIFVPPHLAYGRGGLAGQIPPNKVLVFEIELLAVDEMEEKGVGGA